MAITRINNRYEFDVKDPSHVLGKGGMGIVYKGLDTVTQDTVAVKLLKNELISRDPDMVHRFEREGRALSQLNHPNIVKVLDMIEEDDGHFLVMEYVPGGSLYDVLKENKKFTLQRALYTALDLADALTRAHRLNILHRDIKPANVMLAADGTPRLTDFGMARVSGDSLVTQDGAIVGTLAYLGPEVFQGEQADERTDIWAFGVMLYEMLIGERPFMHEQPGALINAIMSQKYPEVDSLRPDLPIALVDLINRMLIKDRQARIGSIRMVGTELENIIRGGDAVITPTTTTSTGRFDTPTPTPNNEVITTSQRRAPNNLPAQPTPFVGRRRELNDLTEIMQGGNRLITQIGPGGMGKTRIALEFGEEHLSTFRDGVYFVPLAPVSNAEFVPSTIAESLSFSFTSEDRTQDLVNYLAEKHVLLILDNFEHVTESASLVADLIAGAPNLTVMVTSRERLRLRGETIYEIDGMILPRLNSETSDTILEYPAVKLFMQSARRVMPDFEIDSDDTANDVGSIINMVQGLPLGIELAAAWLEMLPVDEISNEISRSLDFLETDLRDVPERHRSLRAVFEYSWNLMNEAERETFLKLSVFRGGFERDAAQNIADASLRVLTTLVNKSLLSRDPNGRYKVNKLLRQYAEERFKDDATREDVCTKHAQYYGKFLLDFYPMFTSKHEAQAIVKVETELDNVMASYDWALKQKKYEEIADSMYAIAMFYLSRSLLIDGKMMFQRFINELEANGKTDTRYYWESVVQLATFAGRLGYYEYSHDNAQKALAYFMSHQLTEPAAFAMNTVAYALMSMGEFERSIEYSAKASELMQDLSDLNIWYMAMGNMGYAEFLRGDFQQASIIYETIMYTSTQHPISRTGKAFMKNNMGEIYRELGNIAQARDLFQEAYDIFKSSRHEGGMAFTMNNLAGILFLQSKYKEAREMFEESYRLNKRVGNQSAIGHSLSALGNLAITTDDYAEAIGFYEQALEVRRKIKDRLAEADSLLDLARTYTAMGEFDKAQRNYENSTRIREELGDQIGMAYAVAGRGLVLMMRGEIEEARSSILQAYEAAQQFNVPFLSAQAAVTMGELALHDGRLDEAGQFYKSTLEFSGGGDSDLYTMSLLALSGIARLRNMQGQKEEALALASLILRYPRSFISAVEEYATQLLDELTTELPETTVSSTLEQSQYMNINDTILDLIEAL